MQNIHVTTRKGGYDILIENGLTGRLGERLCERMRPGRVLLAMDTQVDALFGERVRRSLDAMGLEWRSLVTASDVTGGTLNALNDITRAMTQWQLGAQDTLLIVGGAMLCDTGAFALINGRCPARLVQSPTTLLGMADWAVYGKTAVEHHPGSRMIGSFFAPGLILIDPQTAYTLPERQFLSGMGEMIKCAASADAGMFHLLESLTGRAAVESRLEELTWACLSIKAELGEEGQQKMRLGHNLAYAIEMAQHHRDLTHGEAVAVGMLGVTCLCEAMGRTARGTTDRLEECLKKYGLPTRARVETDVMRKALASLRGTPEVVLERIGWCDLRHVEEDFLTRAWFGDTQR